MPPNTPPVRFRRAALCSLLTLLPALPGCRGAQGKPTPGPANPTPTLSVASASADAPAQFADITKEAGLDFVQSFAGCGQRYFVEQVASGATVIDANGDGYPDLYFPQPKPLGDCVAKYKGKSFHQRLYINDGKGYFTLKSNAFGASETDYGISAASGDFDNDGRPDLYVCCYGRNTLYHNNGDGTFTDVTEKAKVGLRGFSTGAVWFDYDGDGRLDLYVGQYCNWDVDKDIPCTTPEGKPDVCSPLKYDAAQNHLYRNNGDGTFTDVTNKAGVGGIPRRSLGIAAADFNGDGKIDLFVACDLGANMLFLNEGGGKLREAGMEQNVTYGLTGAAQANMGVAVGDYNNTGKLSVLVTTFANEPKTLYRNEGTFFTDATAEANIHTPALPYLAFGTGFFDARNIGRLDIFCANGHVNPFASGSRPDAGYKQRNQLLLNDGMGRFTEAVTAIPANAFRVHRGANFADFDGDGRIDILVTATDDRPTLLKNESPQKNWLMLRLKDAKGCATPVGAKCTATVGSKKLFRVLLGGGSYGGDSDLRVHFGLGDAIQADEIEITWPSGKKQTLREVKANQVLTVNEG